MRVDRPYRGMRATLLLALGWVALEGRAWAEEGCPAAQRVEVDLEAWAKRARKVKTAAAFDKVLAALGWAPDTDEDSACEPRGLQKAKVDLFPARLRDGEEGRVVQVLAVRCPESDGAWQVQRGAAFLPLGKDRWCRVAMPFLDRSGSGWGPQLCEPARFAFQALTSPKRVAVKLIDTQGWCGSSGSDRGNEVTTSFWEVQGWRFAPLLSATTFKAIYHSPTPPIETLTATLRPRGAFPKVIDWRERIQCDDPGEEERRANPRLQEDFADCHPRVTHRRCQYEGGKYTCTARK